MCGTEHTAVPLTSYSVAARRMQNQDSNRGSMRVKMSPLTIVRFLRYFWNCYMPLALKHSSSPLPDVPLLSDITHSVWKKKALCHPLHFVDRLYTFRVHHAELVKR
jgi:hypothetical protein